MKLSELTQEQKRIKIAESCGWIKRTPWTNSQGWQVHEWEKNGMVTEDGLSGHLECELPDYLNDLNAMHEAEKTLDGAMLLAYYFELDELMERPPMVIRLVMATAAQRADAFLLATGRAEL